MAIANIVALTVLCVLVVTRDDDALEPRALLRSDSLRSVVVVTAAGTTDELVAAPLGDAVVTLPPSGVSTATILRLQRLSPTHLLLLGGEDVVSTATAEDLRTSIGATVTRIAGPDRYATAALAALSDFASRDGRVVIAMAGVPPAAVESARVATGGSPVLLVARDLVPPATAHALRRLEPRLITVVGRPSALDDGVLRELERYTSGRVTFTTAR